MSDQNWANDPEQVQQFIARAEVSGMSRRTFLRILAAAGASSAILAACGAPATTAPATTAPAPTSAPAATTGPAATTAPAVTPTSPAGAVQQPQPGQPVADAEQVFRDPISLGGSEPSSMDFNGDLYCGGVTEIWAGLMRFDPDYKPIPYGASKVDVNGAVWTFTLDPNWKWTNGDPVTANDFEWSWHRMLHPGTAAPYSSLLYDVKGAETFNNRKDLKNTNDELTPAVSGVGIKATSASTLEVTLNGPRGYFGAIVSYIAALPNNRKVVEANGEVFKTDAVKSSEPGVIVTNGPFKLTQWVHQKSATMERNDGWLLKPKPTLRKVIMPIIARAQQLASYENNEVDRAPVTPGDVVRIKNDPKLSKEYVSFSDTGVFYLVPDPTFKPFDEKGVRLAIEHAIDRDAIVKNVLQGVGKVAYTFDAPDLPQYIDPNKFPAILPLTKYDPAMAMAMLKGTPYEGGKNWPSGIKLSFRNNEEQIGGPQSAQAIQGMLKDNLNMSVDLDPLDIKVFQNDMWAHKIPFMFVRWYSDYPDSNNNLYQVWYSGSGAAGHRHSYANPAFDKLVTDAKSPSNNDDRIKLYEQAEEVGLNDGYATYVYYLFESRVYKPWVSNLPKNSRGDLVQDVNIFYNIPEALQIVDAPGRPKLS